MACTTLNAKKVVPIYHPCRGGGVACAGLRPDPQRYFDLHHTANDVFEQINHRELKLGAVALTQLVYIVSKYGLQ